MKFRLSYIQREPPNSHLPTDLIICAIAGACWAMVVFLVVRANQ